MTEAQDPAVAASAEKYDGASKSAIEASSRLSTPEFTAARLELYIKAQAERVHHTYAEIAILLKQYMPMHETDARSGKPYAGIVGSALTEE